MSEVEKYEYFRTSDDKLLVSRSVMLKCDTFIPKCLLYYKAKEINKGMIC